MTKNITLAIDETVLEAAREYASAHNTSINALVRDLLASIAARTENSESEWSDLFKLADDEGAEAGAITWTRDGIYGR